jgi:hypothetical protein
MTAHARTTRIVVAFLAAMTLASLQFGPGAAHASSVFTVDSTTPILDWTQLIPAHTPPATQVDSMAFDPAIGEVVAFGGCCPGAGGISDTWVFDGMDWTELTPAHSPPARYLSSMAFDPAIGEILLFGGATLASGQPLSDTWVFDGTDWTELTSAHSPSARAGTSMAFDTATGQLVLFGGAGPSVAMLSDTWAFDGTDWTELTPVHSPSPRYAASMDFDPASGDLVLFGGEYPLLSDTWAFDGTDWTELTLAHSPEPRYGSSMTFDSATGEMILFGGCCSSGGQVFSDTWVIDGADWTQLSPVHSPPNAGSMAFEPSTGLVVLFLTFWDDTGTPFPETWVFGPGPAIASVSPVGVGQGATVGAIVTGSNFQPGVAVSVSGSGVTLASTTFISATKLKAQITVAGDAAVGPRDVTVTETTGTATCSGCLVVDAGPLPTSSSPNAGTRGTTERVAIVGSGFQPGAQVRLGRGVTVNSTRFLSPSLLKASITIDPEAAAGPRTVGVVDPDGGQGSCAACFAVT